MGVTHIVLFKPEIDPALVDALRDDLLIAREAGQVAFERVAVARRVDSNVKDGLLGGAIATGLLSWGRAIIVEVVDDVALLAYYEAPVHAAIRRSFLSSISPRISDLYAEAAIEVGRSAIIFDQIESIAASFMTRLDMEI